MYSQRYIDRIVELLRFNGIEISQLSSESSSEEEISQTLTQAIKSFQDKSGNLVDGIIGPNTLWSLQSSIVRDSQLGLEKVTADLANLEDGEGYDHFWIRKDMAKAYEDLYNEVKEKGGYITSSGSLRALGARVTSNRSPMSLHYCGLALDLSIWSGFQNPYNDIYIVTDSLHDRRFDVWAKSENPACSGIQLDAYVFERGRPTKIRFVDRAFNLSDIMESHGFYPIPPRQGYYYSPPQYCCAEWWHFQYEDALIDGISQLGIELMRTYPDKDLKKCPLWKNRKAIFYNGAFRM